MTCKCIETVNKDLRKNHNTELVWLMTVKPNAPTRCVVDTQVHVSKRGAKPLMVAATYCPFCGSKYAADEVAA
jgi:hypothetical protein